MHHDEHDRGSYHPKHGGARTWKKVFIVAVVIFVFFLSFCRFLNSFPPFFRVFFGSSFFSLLVFILLQIVAFQ